MNPRDILSAGAVIPVIAIDDPHTAVDLAHALVEGGIPTLEITLRTEHGLAAIERITKEVKGAIVGAGTVINGEQLKAVEQAGASSCSFQPHSFCDYTRNANETAEQAAERIARDAAAQAELEGRACPQCGGRLVYKTSRTGSKFIGCANYPKCKHVEPLEKPKDTGVACPQCGQGHLVERKSRFGTTFYSCSSYPECKYAVNHPPLNQPCPQCGWKITLRKTTKRWGVERVCPQKECGWKEQLEAPPAKE